MCPMGDVRGDSRVPREMIGGCCVPYETSGGLMCPINLTQHVHWGCVFQCIHRRTSLSHLQPVKVNQHHFQ